MILRRVARIAYNRGSDFIIAKLDILKNFDSIYQESLAGEGYRLSRSSYRGHYQRGIEQWDR